MTPEEKTSNNSQDTGSLSNKNSIGMKDLLIPVSVVIAGAFIGIGLSMSGGLGDQNTLNNIQQPPSPEGTEPKSLQALVEEAGVSLNDVEQCINDGDVADLVQGHIDNAIATGGRGTPWSIVIGPGGKTYPVNGALPIASLQQAIELARSEAGLPADGSDTDQVSPVTADDNIKGSLDAPIKIVEYSDFDCPFCSRFHASMNQIAENNDDVVWAYRHMPLDQLHPNARTVAQISECVAKLGGNDAFWAFADGYLAQ